MLPIMFVLLISGLDMKITWEKECESSVYCKIAIICILNPLVIPLVTWKSVHKWLISLMIVA